MIFGRLRMGPGGSAVRFEWRYDAEADDVWAAVTQPDRVARWLVPISGEQAVGGVVRVDFGAGATASVLVQECRPGRGMVLEWVFPDGVATPLRVELRRDAGLTVLTLDHAQLPASPAEYAAAWQVNLDRLAAEVAGCPYASDHDTEFAGLLPFYEAAWRRLVDV